MNLFILQQIELKNNEITGSINSILINHILFMSSFFSDVINLIKEPLNAIHSHRNADLEEQRQRLFLKPNALLGHGPVTEKVAKIVRNFIKDECGVPSENISLFHDGKDHEDINAVGHLNSAYTAAILFGGIDVLKIHNSGMLTPIQKFIIAHEVCHLVHGHSFKQGMVIKKSSKTSLLAWGVCAIALPCFNIASIPFSYLIGCIAGKVARYVSSELLIQQDEDEADDFAKVLSQEIRQGGVAAIHEIQQMLKARKLAFPTLKKYLSNYNKQPGYPSPWQYCKDFLKDCFIANNGDNFLNLSHLSSRRIRRLL